MGSILARNRVYLALIVAAAALPRAIVLGYERGRILNEFVEKSDDFASTWVSSGAFGFIPHVPSAYTQPLYGWFLAALYWPLSRNWLVVGVAQIAVAVATALLVYLIGSRYISQRAGFIAAIVSTLHPYLVWHDVHVNREILDQFVGAAVFLLVLVVAGRRSFPLAALLGLALGLAVLGNSRLLVLPVLVAAYLLWQRANARTVAVVLVATALTVTPWIVRNKVVIGCAALTTDSRALWKANNVNTYDTLAAGKWLDDVPLRGQPPSPQDANREYDKTGQLVRIDECRQMRHYQRETLRFWRDHPGEKAKLVAQATRMFWDPRPTLTDGGTAEGGHRSLRTWSEALFALPVFAFAALGLRSVSRRFLVLALSFLAYETLMAAVFAGATRYRVAWDFVLALLAAAALDRLLAHRARAAR
jgi:4-amino-4-deoxy-L-arabinose transferase-like glycosyltransferase